MLNSEILMAVKKLTDLMKEDKTYTAVTAAGDEYEKNSVISTAMTEYTVQQQALAAEYSKSERDDALCEAIQQRINALYEQIISTPEYEAYKRASDEYEVFYNAVFEEINFQLTGKRSSCSGDCSTCGGCH